ncbi:ribosome maturation factor RimM [Ammoniphilus sp. CFH 90114]|uniref:ribosome maturation factor RimM n=1 Tax=Ammoniphilus sp. CFH 90114 TaxID=2493665 RepID=UPI00100F78FE|nr:ribosome maturation factor RimM [Ammoniphilus sp. CFH 90114]RXT15090.1 ribosome maturation factor RimM [Ammoniphilus sp. CFH 90114]
MSTRYYEVGKIANTHGIKGELKIHSVTDFPEERYKKGSQLLLFHPNLSEPLTVTVEAARLQKNTYIIKLKEYGNINDVEKYKGGSLKVAEDQRLDLEEDEFYYDDIMGCEVWTDEGNQLGLVKEIITTGANDVWVVKTKEGKEVLLPYIEDCILNVDIANKKITAHIMEGLM